MSFIAKHDEKQLQRVADTMSTAAENASSRTSLGHSLHEAALVRDVASLYADYVIVTLSFFQSIFRWSVAVSSPQYVAIHLV